MTDLLKDEIKGPASFNCVGPNCAFSEPAMDDLISAVFGDDSIFLSCNSGECLHYTMVPGFEVSFILYENGQKGESILYVNRLIDIMYNDINLSL